MVSYFRVGMRSGLLWSGLIVSCRSRYDNYVNNDFNFYFHFVIRLFNLVC